MSRKFESLTAEDKLGLYQLAIQLFDSGHSHPQIVEELNRFITEPAASIITDKAFKGEWDKLYVKGARLLAKGKLWNEVVEELSAGEPYPDVVELLVNDIYKRRFDVMGAEDEFQQKFGIWGYLLIMGIIQLIRYLIAPYNLIYFWISMLIGTVGLCWGLWEFFFSKKHNEVFKRYIEYEIYKDKMSKLNRIESLFLDKSERVLNIYCTAGFPELDSTLKVMKALQDNGADMIELGMPYSDPLADGPVIQHSSTIAIANGMTIAKLFEQLKDFRKSPPPTGGDLGGIPVILMGYMNPVLQYGFEKFCKDAAAVGIDGLILPDLPIYEFETEYGAIVKKYGLDFIFLVTPETSEERIKKLDELSSGFLYAVSSSSTTGKDNNLADQAGYFKKLKTLQLKNPVLIGFGIKDKLSFEAACSHANGAIIGSAFIKALDNKGTVESSVKQFMDAILVS